MPETSADHRPAIAPSELQQHSIKWLIGAAIGSCLAALVAAHLPDRVKLLGLFPLVWGAAAGGGIGWWANECRVRSTRWIWIVTATLLALGEAGIVMEAWRVYRSELQVQFAKDPSARFMPVLQPGDVAKLTPAERVVRQQLEAEQERGKVIRQRALSLPAFLQRRLKRLGSPSSPWPETFWAGEIVLGSLIGAWVMGRVIVSERINSLSSQQASEANSKLPPLRRGGRGG